MILLCRLYVGLSVFDRAYYNTFPNERPRFAEALSPSGGAEAS